MRPVAASSCVASVADDGTLTLRLRLPDCLAVQHGKICDHRSACASPTATSRCWRRWRATWNTRGAGGEHGEKAARATSLGQAISYRFKRDKKGWRVFASTNIMDVPVVTDKSRGAVGVDLNAEPSRGVRDRRQRQLRLTPSACRWLRTGSPSTRLKPFIGDAVAGAVEYAREVGKPIVIEKLDFRQKKAVLEGESHRYSRMLSSFSYGKIKACFLSRAPS